MSDTTPTPPPVVTEGDREAVQRAVGVFLDPVRIDRLTRLVAQAREEGAEDTRRLNALENRGTVQIEALGWTGTTVIIDDEYSGVGLRAAIDAFREERDG